MHFFSFECVWKKCVLIWVCFIWNVSFVLQIKSLPVPVNCWRCIDLRSMKAEKYRPAMVERFGGMKGEESGRVKAEESGEMKAEVFAE